MAFYAPVIGESGHIDFGLSVCLFFLKKFNFGHNFWTLGVRVFIFHMRIPCEKTFHLVLKGLTSWPWRLHLTLNILLGLSYVTCEHAFLSFGTNIFLTSWPSRRSLSYFWNTLALAITFDSLMLGIHTGTRIDLLPYGASFY